jgi:hypothetical protein
MFRKSLKITKSDSKSNLKQNVSTTPHEFYHYSSPTMITTQPESILNSKQSNKAISTSAIIADAINVEAVGSDDTGGGGGGVELNESEDYGEVLEADDDEDDDDEDEVDDELKFIAPLVQVKFPCEYEYDERKFQLVENEKLFLINKANQDWWLCLRIEDNLTFFAPASYLKEIERDCTDKKSGMIKPPPRPPPPPPSALDEAMKHTHEILFQNDDESAPNYNGSSLLDPNDIISDLDERLNIESRAYEFSDNNPEEEQEEDEHVEDEVEEEEKERFKPAEVFECVDQHIYQNVPPLNARNSLTSSKKTTIGDHKLDQENEQEVDEEEYENAKEYTEGFMNSENSDDSVELSDKIKVPKGWNIEPSKYERKCFVNELTDERVRERVKI